MITKRKIKAAFTLAEVLVTLTIIGVVASLTIPGLMQSVGDSQNKIVWKKDFAVLSQATDAIIANHRGTLKGVFHDTDEVRDEYAKYLLSAKECGWFQNCWHNTDKWYYLDGGSVSWGDDNGGTGPGFILANGSLVAVHYSASDCSNEDWYGGQPICGWIYTDVNGHKGPNTIGKDIFWSWIREYGLEPVGSDNGGPAMDCDSGGDGYGCAALYLTQ